MNYNRDTKDQEFLEVVQNVLDRYIKNIYDVSAGARILDYYERGFIVMKPNVTFCEYVNEHKDSHEFRVIRLARKNKLKVVG